MTQGHDPADPIATVDAELVIDVTEHPSVMTQVQAAGDRARHRPMFTFAEAAERTGVSRETIKRRHKDGVFPNAVKETRNNVETWVIPVEDLLGAGFRVNAPAPPEESTTAVKTQVLRTVTPVGDPAASPDVTALAAELAEVQAQLDEERRRRVLVEGERDIAVAKLAVHEEYRETVHSAMRMLEVGTSARATGTDDTTPASADQRRGWFRR